MASKEVVDFFKQRKLDLKLLHKLKNKMNSLNGLLEDAEDKQITNSAVRKWLDDLKDIAYEADDFLDEITYKAREQQEIIAGPKTCSDQVINFFSSLNPCKKGMGELQPRLEEIFERMDDLLQQNDFLHLEMRDRVKPSSLLSQERLTTSLVDESGVYGRDDDKEAIIKLLLTDDKCLGVIPIVGMGGVGKTTLSQLVYKESRVMQKFNKLRAWVCVSEESDILNLTKNILKEVGSQDCDLMTPNQLQLALEEKVKGERLLLVLDDIWNNLNWEFLLAPLKSSANGSKVLITTREKRIASRLSTVPSYDLKELSEDDCWSLFARHALEGCDSNSYADLEEVGRKIVRKCKGLPLAAKTIGSLLRCERKVREWEKILESNVWEMNDDKIIPALRLSYHYLPSHLKQCFVYCAMFPKDFPHSKEDLILLWMAEGFIIPNNRRREMEEIGEEYFEDLLSRSFFQKYEGFFFMHDLISDLAKSIAGEFCYNNVDDASSGLVTEKTRHIFYKGRSGRNVLKDLESLSKAKLLRTFIFSFGNKDDEDKQIVNEVVNQAVKLLSSLGRLRVLGLSAFHFAAHKEEWENISDLVSSAKHLRFMRLQNVPFINLPNSISNSRLQTLIISNSKRLISLSDSIGDLKDLRYLSLFMIKIKSLPGSIGKLKDLRYLNLESAWELESLSDSIGDLKELRHLVLEYTSLERLPESICGLYNLQQLSLRDCDKLVELPAKMMDLVNLCHIDLSWTKLKSMPSQMGKLVKLQTLTDFFVGEDGRGSSIAELGHLRNLQGRLCLRNLQNVRDMQDALEVNLKDKSRLEELQYVWGDDDSSVGTPDGSVDRSLLQHLQPHVNVKNIDIVGYRGTNFPTWIEASSSFTNIVSLILFRCKFCTRLPSLGQLGSLQSLHISEFSSVVSVGAEFHGDSKSIQPFRSLASLTFTMMKRWQIWKHTENDGRPIFPLLQDLTIDHCPALEMTLTEGIFPSTLQSLYIHGCKNIISRRMHWDLRKFSSLSKFSFGFAEDIRSFPDWIFLPSTLTRIEIWNLENLESLQYAGLQHLTSLRTLRIYNCPKVTCIPDEGLPESLHHLSIQGCPLLGKRCQKEQGEDWPKISRIQMIDIV